MNTSTKDCSITHLLCIECVPSFVQASSAKIPQQVDEDIVQKLLWQNTKTDIHSKDSGVLTFTIYIHSVPKYLFSIELCQTKNSGVRQVHKCLQKVLKKLCRTYFAKRRRDDIRARASAMLTFAIYLEYVPKNLC